MSHTNHNITIKAAQLPIKNNVNCEHSLPQTPEHHAIDIRRPHRGLAGKEHTCTPHKVCLDIAMTMDRAELRNRSHANTSYAHFARQLESSSTPHDQTSALTVTPSGQVSL